MNIDTAWMLRGPAGLAAVLTAFAIDHGFGEPPLRWHPVAWIGRALSATRAPWPDAGPSPAFAYGALTWVVGAAASAALAAALAQATAHAVIALTAPPASEAQSFLQELLQGAVLGVWLKPLLSWRMLRDEVAAVERELTSSLGAGRARLSRLVSRDTASLSASEVRESALESLAENLNDSLVAPLFWFALGGLPAAAVYRFANTADAMWGYRGRWEWSGKWVARADDVLSYVPARLTAMLVALVALCPPRRLFREAQRTPSPNGGWPMSMLALALGIRLSKPGVYVLNARGRPPVGQDMVRGLALAQRAAWAAVLLAGAGASRL